MVEEMLMRTMTIMKKMLLGVKLMMFLGIKHNMKRPMKKTIIQRRATGAETLGPKETEVGVIMDLCLKAE